MFSCLGLLSCVFFCIVWFCLLVSWPSNWLGRLTVLISFVSKGFFYKDQIEELFIVVVYRMYSQHVKFVTLSTFSLISLFNCNILFTGTIYLSVLKVPLYPNQAIYMAIYQLIHVDLMCVINRKMGLCGDVPLADLV